MDANNIDDRWNMIGELVYRYGTEDDKLAWGLCRGDAAEWKLSPTPTEPEGECNKCNICKHDFERITLDKFTSPR